MNHSTETGMDALLRNASVAGALAVASHALCALNNAGVTVLSVLANGRRPLLIIDRIPDDVISVIKRRHPNGVGGTTVVRAAEWHGCQLEASCDVPRPNPLRALEVVRG